MTRSFFLLLWIPCISALMDAHEERNDSAPATGQHALRENQSEWIEGSEDSMSYEYAQHEGTDRVELSDDWLILHGVEEEPTDAENKLEDDSQEEEESEEEESEEEESLDCDQDIPKKTERRFSPRKEEFYFMHKKYGKKPHRSSGSKGNWKKNCCIRGKRVGNSKKTFLADDLFQECQQRARHLPSRISRHCKWIFWSCCEARALRRFYVHFKSRRTDTC